jgi:hypothetical protein
MQEGTKWRGRPSNDYVGWLRMNRVLAFWSLRANTPFHGWGRSGQVETTALVVSALVKWRKVAGNNADLDTVIDRGVLFLVKNAGSDGAWSTTQATVRVLDALLDVWSRVDQQKGSSVTILVNGVSVGTVAVPAGNVVRGPVIIDTSRFVHSGVANEVAFIGADSHPTQAQINAAWYQAWDKP